MKEGKSKKRVIQNKIMNLERSEKQLEKNEDRFEKNKNEIEKNQERLQKNTLENGQNLHTIEKILEGQIKYLEKLLEIQKHKSTNKIEIKPQAALLPAVKGVSHTTPKVQWRSSVVELYATI